MPTGPSRRTRRDRAGDGPARNGDRDREQPGPAAALRRLELEVGRRLDGLRDGDRRGLGPGRSTEAGDTRQYQPGDDVRRIDWNVTARTQAPHVRETIAERELETWLLADLSPSLDFGTARATKREVAEGAAGTLALLATRDGDRLGAVLLTGDGTATLPAGGGRDHRRAIMHRILAAPHRDGSGATDLRAGIERLAGPGSRRGLAVVVSDFLADAAWQPALRAVAARHEVLAVEVLDPRELELPDVGVLVVRDPETGRQREVRTSDRRLRERYARAAAARRRDVAAGLRRAGADHVVLRTDRDWLADLVRFVALRRHRLDHLRRARGH